MTQNFGSNFDVIVSSILQQWCSIYSSHLCFLSTKWKATAHFTLSKNKLKYINVNTWLSLELLPLFIAAPIPHEGPIGVKEKDVEFHAIESEGKLVAVRGPAELVLQFQSPPFKLCYYVRIVVFYEDSDVNILSPGKHLALSVETCNKWPDTHYS